MTTDAEVSVPSVPSVVNVGLLLLRAGAGLSLCFLFGIPKLRAGIEYLHSGHWQFIDFNRTLGLPAPELVAYFQTLNESLVAFLAGVGLWTRYAACFLVVGFIGATICSLKAQEASWLTAGYLALIFSTIALTGPGKFSIDALLRRQ